MPGQHPRNTPTPEMKHKRLNKLYKLHRREEIYSGSLKNNRLSTTAE